MIPYVKIDWDCIDWADVFDFTTEGDDISADVRWPVRINRGEPDENGIYPAATCEIILNNHTGKYYITKTTSEYYLRNRIWLPVQVSVEHNSITYIKFTGFINKIVYKPLLTEQYAYFYATDGIDLMSKTIVTQDLDDKTVMTDGDAIELTLDAGGWNATRRLIDVDGGDITNFPDTFEFTKP